MKKKIYSWSLAIILAVFTVSCSESEDLIPMDAELKAVSAAQDNSPFLVTSPTEVYFTDVEFNSIARDTVNVKIAGLPLLATLTSFDIIIQGPGRSHFRYEVPQLGLLEFLQALLGGRVDIPVSYQPYIPGSHEAELLITASLLGVLAPVQTTIPLHGNTSYPIPQLVNTIPVNGGTVEYDGMVPDSDRGEYHIDFIFDQDIQLNRGAFIQLEKLTSASIVNREIVNGNTLRIKVWEIPLASLPNTVVIFPNSVISTQAGGLGDVKGNTLIRLDYIANGGRNIPQE